MDVHIHPEDDALIKRNEVVSRMHSAINHDPTRPIRRVYNECIVIDSADDDEDAIDSVPEFDEFRSSLARKRRNYYPAIPKTIGDVQVRGQCRKTWNAKDFLVHQDTQWGLLIFLSPTCAVKLQQCDDVYVDGTFSTCPKPFKQLVTIHGKYGDRVLPFAFCMLRSKETALYREMFRQIRLHITRITGYCFQPSRILCDFEMSLISAIQTEFPQASLHGCYFHYCQSIWRKVQELGLTTAYRRQRSVKNIIRRVMSLGYVPTALVRLTFNLIYSSRSAARLMRNVPGLQQFVDYFRQNYIDGNFRPTLWNVFNRDVDFRTNNHVEGENCLKMLFKKSLQNV